MLLRPARLAALLLLLTGGVAIATLLLGVGSGWRDALSGDAFALELITQLRAPRLLTAMAAGCVLAVAGAAMQAQFRNPLAEPGLIGVSSGAALGAAFALSLGAGGWLVAVVSFAGALLASTVAQRIAGLRAGTADLLLAGVAVNSFAGAALTLIITFADDRTLRGITFWLLGSFTLADWPMALSLLAIAALITGWIWRCWPLLNTLLLGERVAFHTGFDAARERRKLTILTAAAVGITVAAVGTISFVGLIVPHILRRLSGGHYRTLIPLTALGGALALALADLVARQVMPPAELPVGAITSLAGAPFFLWLLRGRRSA